MDWVTTTAKQVEELRVDYLLASNRPADARVLIEQALERLNADSQPSERTFYDRTGWLRRLADAEVQENRAHEALDHYQASLSGLDKKLLAMPQAERMSSPVKRYYLRTAAPKRGGRIGRRPGPRISSCLSERHRSSSRRCRSSRRPTSQEGLGSCAI